MTKELLFVFVFESVSRFGRLAIGYGRLAIAQNAIHLSKS